MKRKESVKYYKKSYLLVLKEILLEMIKCDESISYESLPLCHEFNKPHLLT